MKNTNHSVASSWLSLYAAAALLGCGSSGPDPTPSALPDVAGEQRIDPGYGALDNASPAGERSGVSQPAVGVSTGSPPSLRVEPQALTDLSTHLVVSVVLTNQPTWVVIHEVAAGQPGASVGFALVQAGTSPALQVTLNRPAKDGEDFVAMLHTDQGAGGVFEFPGPDGPISDGGGKLIESPFRVSVPDGTPAVRLQMTSNGMKSYVFTGVSPRELGDVYGSTSENPELRLKLGWRYEVVSEVTEPHPFDLIVRGSSPSRDVVLLSEVDEGSLESDASIGWFEDGKQSFRFTVSSVLASQLNGYRCSYHPRTMRGVVSVGG